MSHGPNRQPSRYRMRRRDSMLGAATAVLLALLAAAPASASQAPTAATSARPQPGPVSSGVLGATRPDALTAAQAAPLPPVDALPRPQGKDLQDPNQCLSYGRSQAHRLKAGAAWTTAETELDSILTIAHKPEAKALFDQYLTHGVMSAERQEVTDPAALAEFAASPQTSQAYRDVQTAARKAVLARPNLSLSSAGTLHDLGVGQRLTINWPLPAGNPLKAVSSTPGLIAGGTGSLIGQRGNYQDRRDIDGVWSIVPVFAPNGDLVKVVLRLSDVFLLVQDSIDFCPGAIGTSFAVRQLLLPLSRLERTPRKSGGGFTQPVLWQAHVALPSVDMDVSSAFLHRFPSEIHAKIVITSVDPPWDGSFASGTVTADYVPVPGACPQGQAVRAPCQYQLKDPQASSGFMLYHDTVDQCNGTTSMPPWAATADSNPDGAIFFSDLVTPGTFTSVSMNFGGSAYVPITCADGGGGLEDATYLAETDQNGGTWSPGLSGMHFDIHPEVSHGEGTVDLTFTY